MSPRCRVGARNSNVRSDGPTCRRLIEEARQRNDRRALRLLGVDEQRPGRSNSLFRMPDEVRWKEWLEEDREVLKQRMPN